MAFGAFFVEREKQMGIVQFYKSQLQIGTPGPTAQLWPIPPGGAALNWPKNHVIPPYAGNYWQINYIEGAQSPTVDAQIGLLDVATICPLVPATMNALFMTRSNDYHHDISAIPKAMDTNTVALKFFDGFSGFPFTDAKAGSFSLSGSKGDDVRFNASFMPYSAASGSPLVQAAVPTVSTSVPSSGYPFFSGTPIRFQSLLFRKGASLAALSPLDGVMSFSLSFSNNCTPDWSMVSGTGTPGGQNVFPVDINAGMMSAACAITFQADQTNHLANGDVIEIGVKQGAIECYFKLQSTVWDTNNNRNIGAGRQTRTYNATVVGVSNLPGGAGNNGVPLRIAATTGDT